MKTSITLLSLITVLSIAFSYNKDVEYQKAMTDIERLRNDSIVKTDALIEFYNDPYFSGMEKDQ